MAPLWWSVLLSAVGILGLYIAGRGSYWGWAIGLAAQALWLTYSISTQQWGFLASVLGYGSVYARNIYRWRKKQTTAPTVATVALCACPHCPASAPQPA